MPPATRAQHVVTAIRRASVARKPLPSPRQRRISELEDAELGEEPQTRNASSQMFSGGRPLAWVLTSLVAGGMGVYCAGLYMDARKPLKNPAIADLSQQKDVSGRYEDTADTFDSEVGVSEMLMGVNSIRKRLAKKCTGHVLEVSCGTGRNLGYFDIGKNAKIESLTFVDLSPQMIEICKKKWSILQSSEKDKLKPGLQIRFLKGSALDELPLAPNNAKYDSIIQTMGLCSTPAPVELLTNMVKHLDTSNPDARILLLERGRSYQDWLNRILDNSAEKHAEIHGCWFNRDIGALVEDAARQTGLEVVSERRHHVGTTWVFELKPSTELVERSSTVASSSSDSSGEQQSSTWRSWLGLK